MKKCVYFNTVYNFDLCNLKKFQVFHSIHLRLQWYFPPLSLSCPLFPTTLLNSLLFSFFFHTMHPFTYSSLSHHWCTRGLIMYLTHYRLSCDNHRSTNGLLVDFILFGFISNSGWYICFQISEEIDFYLCNIFIHITYFFYLILCFLSIHCAFLQSKGTMRKLNF